MRIGADSPPPIHRRAPDLLGETQSTMRPAHRAHWALRVLDRADVRGLETFRSLGHVKLDLLSLLQGTEAIGVDRRMVAKNVFAPAVLSNEAEAFGVVEPLHSAACHIYTLSRNSSGDMPFVASPTSAGRSQPTRIQARRRILPYSSLAIALCVAWIQSSMASELG